MRNRLIELIRNAPRTDTVYGDIKLSNPVQTLQTIADYILANGVIVPPCKVGSKIYMLVTKRSKVCLPLFTFIKVSRLTFSNLERVIQDFGKTVFLTREEAEKALVERSNENAE